MGAFDSNLAAAMRVRDKRNALSLDTHSGQRVVGGVLPDTRWDAFFGAHQQQESAAHAAGMNYSIKGLRNAAKGRR